MKITLSTSEMLLVGQVGVSRRVVALRRQRSQPYGTPASSNGVNSDLWGMDVESCGAEYAVSKALNQRWCMEVVGDLSTAPPDVGFNVQVRWTAHERGHLPVYHRDSDLDRFFLVTGKMPTYTVCGWMDGWEAKSERYACLTPRGVEAFWVPQAELNEVEALTAAA